MPADLRQALRQFARTPLATAAAILSLALGIGANAAIFRLVDSVLLRTLAIPEPNRLVRLALLDPAKPGRESGLPYALYEQLAQRPDLPLQGLFAWNGGGIFQINAQGARFIGSAAEVSPGALPALGLAPALGRLTLAPGEAVITHACWRRHYAGDPAALGAVIRLEDRPFTITGVLPETFHGLQNDVATEAHVAIGQLYPGSRAAYEVYGLRRTTEAQARAWAATAWPALRTPPFQRHQLTVLDASSGTSFLRNQYRAPLLVLMGMVAALLLIACVNLAGLMLARATARENEFAIRLALGAGQWRITRQILAESLLLAAAGAIPALFLARWAVGRILGVMWTGFVPLSFDGALDARLVAFTAALALVSALLFGLWPAWRLRRQLTALRSSSRSVHRGGRSSRWLVTAQVALSLMLVFTALAFGRSLGHLLSLPPGYRPDGILMAQLFPRAGSERAAFPHRADYYRELAQRVAAIPGVEAVSYSHMGPVLRYESKSPVQINGQSGAGVNAVFELAGPGFFSLAGVRLLAGREFTWNDHEQAPRVAIISESLARRLFPAGNALGQRIDHGDRQGLEIVGVVESASLWMRESRQPPAVYKAFLQEPKFNSSFLDIRYRGPAESISAAARQAIESLGRQQALSLETAPARADRLLARQRLLAALAGFLAALALLLAAVGLYAVLAQAVGQRRAEIGVRLALGATGARATWAILRDTLAAVALGAALALPGAWAVARTVDALLFETSAADPGAIAGALALLLATIAAAAAGPARRATRVDPAAALRSA